MFKRSCLLPVVDSTELLSLSTASPLPCASHASRGHLALVLRSLP